MRAASSAGCGVVLAMIAVSGCAPFFPGAAGPAPSEGVYSAEARVAASEGMYGDVPHPEAAPPAVEAPAEQAQAPAADQEPQVFVVRTNRCCPGPVIVTVACADTSGAREEAEAAPPAPYKPWPAGRRAPSLYHDR